MIKLTEKAKLHFEEILKKYPKSLGISLTVKKSGCSGNSYVLDLLNVAREDLDLHNISGMKFYISNSDLPLLEGLELDCIQQGLSTHIKFNNPNSTGECGCGESFSVD